MKHYGTIISLTALAFAGVGAICTSYHHPGENKGSYFTKEELDTIYDATFQVDTTVTLEQKVDDDIDFEKSWFGSGTLMLDSQTGDNYILTAEHVTPDGTYINEKTKVTAKVIKEVILIERQEASVFKEDEKKDLALLKVNLPLKDINGQPRKPFNGKIAKDLNLGDYVIGVGFPKGNKELFNTRVTEITEDRTFLDIYMVSGNSGGGVYIIHGKDLQLCSLVSQYNNVPSLKKVREFFKGTPLEDDYL